MMRVRFPVVDFMAILKRENSGKDFSQGRDSSFMHIVRICSTSWVEFNVEVHIMKWF